MANSVLLIKKKCNAVFIRKTIMCVLTIKVHELIAEHHCAHLQSTPIGKLHADASTKSTLQNNFGTDFVEQPSQLP
jgi:hypothetical protein